MTILALYSNKGGVGKTAAAVNLAYLAARDGLSTLLCDLDPQGSATYYLRVKPKLKAKARGLTQGGRQIERSIKGSDFELLDLLPSDFTNRNLDITFEQLKRRKHRLNAVLDPLRKQYDLIFLDCPPTFNIVAENIFNVSDALLVPLPPTTLSVRSFEQLRQFLNQSRRGKDRVSVFLSMVDRRKKLQRELVAALPGQIDCLLDTAIPNASQVERMGIHRQPVPVYAPRSRAARSYADLWREIDATLLDNQAP